LQFKRKYRITVSSAPVDVRNTYTNYADYVAAQQSAKSQAAFYLTPPPDRVGTVQQWVIEDLRVNFKIEAGVSASPNKTLIKIYNLNETHRKQLHTSKLAHIKVEAGYEFGSFGTIFVGQVRQVFNRLDVTDWITEIEAADGEVAQQTCQIAFSSSKSPWSKAAVAVADAMLAHFPAGNLKEAVAEAVARDETDKRIQGDPLLSRGVNIHGSGLEGMRELLNHKGIALSVDKGALLALHPTSIRNPAVVLGSESGLIGFPELTTAITKKGASQLKVKCLINPMIDPGRGIIVDLPDYKNQTYRVESLSHEGDSWDGDWLTNILAKRIK
jgi:hypothetical protein